MDDVVGTWQVCSPASVKSFSAVEYFFGRHLQQNLHVPMGLIESDWGGTPAQSWTLQGSARERPGAEVCGATIGTRCWPTIRRRRSATTRRTLAAWKKARRRGARPRARRRRTGRALPQGPGHPNTPAGLYNGMIAPLVPYGIRGAIWYQGEIQRQRARGVQVPAAVRGHDPGLAQSLGAGRFPVPLRATGELQEQRLLAGAARIADRDAAPGQHRDGGDHRHRRIAGHSSEEQAGRGTAAGAGGARR